MYLEDSLTNQFLLKSSDFCNLIKKYFEIIKHINQSLCINFIKYNINELFIKLELYKNSNTYHQVPKINIINSIIIKCILSSNLICIDFSNTTFINCIFRDIFYLACKFDNISHHGCLLNFLSNISYTRESMTRQIL